MKNRKASPEILGRLATNLRRLRKDRGYTQDRLGRRCGLTKNYISNIECETVNISLANLETLAIALDCLARDLLIPVIAPPPNKNERWPQAQRSGASDAISSCSPC